MNKNVLWAIRLMAVCVAGIIALQFFYSVQNYAIEKRNFSKTVNEAFQVAVDSSFSARNDAISETFRTWISDTASFKITCRVNPKQNVTVFTIAEKLPPFSDQNSTSLSIETFTEKRHAITTKARAIFIDHLVESVRTDLKKGYVFYYTKQLGDKLEKERFFVPIDTGIVRKEYRRELDKRAISLDFSLDPKQITSGKFTTNQINLALKQHVKPRWIRATFPHSAFFVFQKLKWSIAGSGALLLLTFFCFGYTLKLLFTQEKLAKVKDDFINNMTHELHTPLASIIVTAEALQKFEHDKQSQKRYLEIILHQSKRLDSLSSEILDSARMRENTNGNFASTDLNTLIQEAISAFPEVAFDCFIPATEIAIQADRDQLIRMLRNLFDNSVKYANVENLNIRISVSVVGQKINMEISDNGRGIPKDEKSKIFDAFYRIPTGNLHEVKGYGLGLHFVKQVLQNHGGSISVVDAEPQGTLFKITLPK